KQSKLTTSVSLVKASEFFTRAGIETIALMKINIEGGEYDLLDHLIETGFVSRIDNIQVQFHDFVAEAESRMVRIQERLSQTHAITYQYPFVWENWRKL
ncbi:MAG: FkbM family methyltransferase, partial [Deltaproteobacteria bacterium]